MVSMDDESEFKLNYENKLVAYIDVLGFKELIPADEGDTERSKRIEDYFDTVLKDLKHLSNRKKGLEKLLLSDTILLTYPTQELPTFVEFQEIALAIARVQYALALKGIWTRGALTRGKIHLDTKNNVVVGPALVKAYLLEKEALFPRVIVDPAILYQYDISREEFITKINDHNTHDWKTNIIDTLNKDEPMYIHYLGGLNERRRPDCDSFYEHLRRAIYQSQTHYDKYRWLANYLMESFPRDFQEDMNGFEQKVYNL